MQKKAVNYKVVGYVWVFFCLVMITSIFSTAKAEYRIVYSSHSGSPSSSSVDSVKSSEDIWRIFQKEFTLDHQSERPEIREQIAWYMAHRKYLREAAINARPYMYYIVMQIRKHNLPLEFALLPIIESAYDPFAYSTSGAAGLWQMMPATATDFGLKQNWWYDGRRDVVASTNAALDYLVYLQNFFGGNWMFTVAAYHAGQGTVLNAIKKNAANGDATDFWSLPLGKQTQLYIPKLLALAEMIAHPEKYPLSMPAIPNQPYLTQVDVGSQIDLTKAAKLSGLSLSVLKNLNPGFNRWATAPDGPYLLVVPIQNEAQLRENLSLVSSNNRVTWERYDVQSGDTLSKIATKYHTTMSILQQVNKLDTTLIHVGDVIFIPKSAAHSMLAPESLLESMKSVTTQQVGAGVTQAQSKTVVSKQLQTPEPVAVYIVRTGDTLTSIAHTLDIPWKTLREYNHLPSNVLKVGQKLNIPPLLISNEKNDKKDTQKIRYIVQKNDSLGKIARRFGVEVDDIIKWNPSLKSDSILHPKQKLTIYQALAE